MGKILAFVERAETVETLSSDLVRRVHERAFWPRVWAWGRSLEGRRWMLAHGYDDRGYQTTIQAQAMIAWEHEQQRGLA